VNKYRDRLQIIAGMLSVVGEAAKKMRLLSG
jgi:hypothetical protein